MRLSAKTFAAMLMGLALTAFQFDLDAQSRSGSRSSTSRPSSTSARPAERPSGNRRPDINPADRTPSKPSATKPAVGKPSGNKPSGNKPAVNKPSGNKPPVNRPAVKPDNRPTTRPDVRPRPNPAPRPDLRPAPGHRPPAGPSRPVRPRPPHVVIRPAIGTIVAANLIANTALTIARLSYYNNLTQPRVAQNLASQLGLVQIYADAATTYYYQDGVFYTMAPDGSYYVIVPPAGALVEQLPYDYETVYINGNQYFKVDNTLYQYTVLDGKPFFEVIGQLN